MNKALRAWRASFTRRWHTNPDLCDTIDYVSGHQARVALLILSLVPDVSRGLITGALIHDQGETVVGDISFTAKKENPEIADIANGLEWSERRNQGFHVVVLNKDEKLLLKLCDWLDAWLWMMRHARHLYARKDWQEQLDQCRKTASALGIGEEVEALITAEATR